MRPHDQEFAGLTCAAVMDALSTYVDGDSDLGRDMAARVEAHVAQCRQCERFGAGFVALLQTMRTRLRDATPLPDDVAGRLREKLSAVR